MAERRLGRGLDFLIKKTDPPQEESRNQTQGTVAVDAIRPNAWQPRHVFDLEPLNDLIESIRLHGIIQPIAVRAVEGGYELISGERRWRAAQELGLEEIPATIHEASDQDMLELALVENIQREDLDPIEKARAYQKLMDEFQLSQEETARRLGKKRSTVANYVRLLDLPPKLREMTSAGHLSMGQARALLAFQDPKRQMAAAEAAARGKLTVRDLERLARLTTPQAGSQSPARASGDPHLNAVTQRLRDALGTKVVLNAKGKKGRIVIDYFDTKSLNRILECIERGAERAGEAGL